MYGGAIATDITDENGDATLSFAASEVAVSANLREANMKLTVQATGFEEYENDILLKGSYYKRNEKIPVSTIIHGNGEATIYDKDGNFLKKIKYIKGNPEE